MANVTNWLLRRGAGALFNLQRTPLVNGVDALNSNPKKTQVNNVYAHTHQYLTNWPDKTVYKISGGQGVTMNSLELETTYTWTCQYIRAHDDNNSGGDIILFSIINAASTNASDEGIAPVKWPSLYGGSDLTLYTYAEFSANEHFTEDTNNDGIPEDYYNVYEVVVTGIELGTFIVSGNVLTYQTAPSIKPYTIPMTSGNFPDWTCYADFGSTPFYAPDIFTSASYVYGPFEGVKLCARDKDDSAHNLSSYLYLFNSVPSIGTNNNYGLVIGSYRHGPTDSPGSFGQALLKADCECKFYYTPDACDDCWYAGKTVTLDITYKKIEIVDGGPTMDGAYLSRSASIGTVSTHSVVTKTLTLPSGHSRQQVGSTFTVPTLAGYAVVIDDIKLVSVS